MNWGIPGFSPVPPTHEATGGPGGAGDAFLKLQAVGGGGPGSRLSVLNSTQWTMNYTTAGVLAIGMDVNNSGPDEAHLRLLFEDFGDGGGPPVNLALSATAIAVPAGSGWRHVVFAITADELMAVTGTANGALASTDILRLFHNPEAAFPGPGSGPPPVSLTLGVDNIESLIPEPAALAYSGVVGLAAVRRRRRPSG